MENVQEEEGKRERIKSSFFRAQRQRFMSQSCKYSSTPPKDAVLANQAILGCLLHSIRDQTSFLSQPKLVYFYIKGMNQVTYK